MPSLASGKYISSINGSRLLASFCSSTSPVSSDQAFIQQTCLKAAVALGVGCWEGYVEAALREFVSKVRLQSNRRAWSLIAQFEVLVDKKAATLNTPNWDLVRNLLIEVTGLDPHPAWIWTPKFANPVDTKEFFDGVMKVRHAFAHGFDIPHDISGIAIPGQLDIVYVNDVVDCLSFFVIKTDELLEHELKHRHGCPAGWN